MVNNYLLIVVLLQIIVVIRGGFKMYSEPVNWYQALINCKTNNTELASISAGNYQNELEEFLKNNNGLGKIFWLSGTKEGNGKYYWAGTGSKMDYMKWAVGQPDDYKQAMNYNEGEHCVAIMDDGWTDLTCFEQYPYICQEQTC
ncbi:unnamed protein product [Ceutorhynchus assimilis]|uniref:C-type lectin domain-containing protein n=1 Tax=Ceutorhynchus assimilis TaxID=467358 RepID=A0A9N9QNY8_9CUCU|nr:unnamed protein product [Ceutorhynchus assimilis]